MMRRASFAVLVLSATVVGCSGASSQAFTEDERSEVEAMIDLELPEDVASKVCAASNEAAASEYLFSVGVREVYATGFRGENVAFHVANASCDDVASEWALAGMSEAIDMCERQPADNPCHEVIDDFNDAVLAGVGSD